MSDLSVPTLIEVNQGKLHLDVRSGSYLWSMKTVTKRELNRQTAQVLAAVKVGESVVVTEHGVPRWRIDVFDSDTDPIARLRAQGRIIPAKKDPMPWPEPEGDPRYSPADVDRLYREMCEGDIAE